MAGILIRTKVVATFHVHVDISPTERFRKVKFFIIGYPTHKVVAVTKDLHQSIVEMGNNKIAKKAKVIANGIDINELTDLLKKSPCNCNKDKEIVLGCLGNIRKAKNYFLTVDLIDLLSSKGYSVRLIIAGDDNKPLATQFKNYVLEKGLDDSVELLGFLSDIPQFFKSIDIFLMTSSTEGHPLAFAQALVTGFPKLTTPSVVEEIVTDKYTAFIRKDHTADSLCASFEVTFGNQEHVINAAENHRALAEKNFNEYSMCEKYLSVYI